MLGAVFEVKAMGTRKWLDSEVTVLPGVGESRRKLLTKLGLRTVGDVLYSFPRTYKDFTRVLSPAQIREEGEYLISGELVDLTERPVSGGRRVVKPVCTETAAMRGSPGSLYTAAGVHLHL